MPWQALVVTVDGAIAEALADALLAAGALSATIEDADAGTADEQPRFGEPAMETPDAWPRSKVIGLFDAAVDARQALEQAATLCGLEACPSCTLESVPEQDWVQRTQAQFAPIHIAERVWIVPSWHDAPDAGAINLVLDPGLAFGTGSHPTTRLCLEWLVQHVRGGESMIDYGCGSGILAIAAAKLGAGPVLGVDIDPVAVAAARENARRNDVHGEFLEVNASTATTADIVVANILANPLRLLVPVLAQLTRAGGKLVLAGLLEAQRDEIAAAYAPFFVMSAYGVRDGWIALEGCRR